MFVNKHFAYLQWAYLKKWMVSWCKICGLLFFKCRRIHWQIFVFVSVHFWASPTRVSYKRISSICFQAYNSAVPLWFLCHSAKILNVTQSNLPVRQIYQHLTILELLTSKCIRQKLWQNERKTSVCVHAIA